MSKTRAELEAQRDALIARAKKFLVEVEEMSDEIMAARAEHPDFWTEFDEKRNIGSLRVIGHSLEDMVGRLLLQVGRWDEIMKPGVKWEDLKKKILAKK